MQRVGTDRDIRDVRTLVLANVVLEVARYGHKHRDLGQPLSYTCSLKQRLWVHILTNRNGYMYAAKADLGHDVCGHTWLPPALHLLAPMSERL